jgi:hypothetical protein
MSVTRFIFWMSLASFAFVAGCTSSKPDSEQLDQLMRRTSALEQQVHALEVTNAELQLQVRALQERERLQPGAPPFRPPQFPGAPPSSPPQNPGVPPRSQPPSNEVPHLTPLDTK